MSLQHLTYMNVGDTAQPSLFIEYLLQFTSSDIRVECFFKEKDIPECVTVVHEQSNRLSTGGVMNISSHRFKRNGDTAYGCIDQFSHDKHQVGVIGGRQLLMSITGNCGMTFFYAYFYHKFHPSVNSSRNSSSSLVAIPGTCLVFI